MKKYYRMTEIDGSGVLPEEWLIVREDGVWKDIAMSRCGKWYQRSQRPEQQFVESARWEELHDYFQDEDDWTKVEILEEDVIILLM